MSKEIKYGGITYRSGDIIIASINGEYIKDCKLFIDHKYDSTKIKGFICHNKQSEAGSESPNKLGYKYSWCFYQNDNSELLTDEVLLLENLSINIESRTDLNISFKLMEFLNKYDSTIYKLFLSNKYLPGYNSFDISDNTGMIKLTNKESKLIEVKIGRYLSQSLTKSELSASDIEKFVNEFVSFQKDNVITIEYLKGVDILNGYKRENQLSLSVLENSCMNDKLDLLELYTKNENIISLMVVKCNNRIIGRCLIWTIDGMSYMDRPYYSYDWIAQTIISEGKSKGYLLYGNLGNTILSVKLDHFNFSKYPFLDTFRYMTDDGYLHTHRSVPCKILDRVDGTVITVDR